MAADDAHTYTNTNNSSSEQRQSSSSCIKQRQQRQLSSASASASASTSTVPAGLVLLLCLGGLLLAPLLLAVLFRCDTTAATNTQNAFNAGDEPTFFNWLLPFIRHNNNNNNNKPPSIDYFLRIPNNDSASQHLRALTSAPHIAGSPENYDTALYVKSKFEEYGFKTHIAQYDVLLTYPIRRSLSIVEPFKHDAKLKEDVVDEDPSTKDPRVLDPFLGYTPSGNATAHVVYVNYGTVEDFARLEKLGVSANGSIVIVRYGSIYRGDKVENAARAGAKAVLIYSDPADYAPDGTGANVTYPRERWLPPSGAQRGSTARIAGDPLTPGWPSSKGGERLDKPVGLPTIPALPISYGNALPILSHLEGPSAPCAWQGALFDNYRLGPGPVKVDLQLEMNNTIAPIHNVIAELTGYEEPNRYVIVGNHRDAWVFGAVDPSSGTAAMLEIARGVGEMYQRGWRPRRTLVLASWDAEEQALIGSTEWVESNEPTLLLNAVFHLNVDSAVSGPDLTVIATPTLDHVVWEVAKRVPDPDDVSNKRRRSLYERWQESSGVGGSEHPTVFRPGGSGSDHSPFIHHCAIPGFIAGFGNNHTDYPVYHSLYDDYRWMELFGDPTFQRHVAIAQMWGLTALRLVDDDVLPLNYTHYAAALTGHVDELEAVLKKASAPATTTVSLMPLRAAIVKLAHEASGVEAERDSLRYQHRDDDLARRLLNDRLYQAERGFLEPQGLPGRPWYRHLVYDPAVHNEYGSTVFPSVADAITDAVANTNANMDDDDDDDDDADAWGVVQHEIYRVARGIERVAGILRGKLV